MLKIKRRVKLKILKISLKEVQKKNSKKCKVLKKKVNGWLKKVVRRVKLLFWKIKSKKINNYMINFYLHYRVNISFFFFHISKFFFQLIINRINSKRWIRTILWPNRSFRNQQTFIQRIRKTRNPMQNSRRKSSALKNIQKNVQILFIFTMFKLLKSNFTKHFQSTYLSMPILGTIIKFFSNLYKY